MIKLQSEKLCEVCGGLSDFDDTVNGLRECDCYFCESCGKKINSEGDDFSTIECEAYCRDCYEDEMEPLLVTKDTLYSITEAPKIGYKAMGKRGYKLINGFHPAYGSTDWNKHIGWRVSSWGKSDGRSLGLEELTKSVADLMRETRRKGVYATITEAGQFQVYIGIFAKP
jgi:hypothetical protein